MLWGALLVVAVAALALAGVRAFAQDDGSAAPATVGEVTATTLRMTYQGRLLDPVSGQPKPDGSYALTFRLYNVESGGAALWTEERSGANAVAVSKGAFSVELGSIAPLPAIFNGQDLWLGITGTTQAGDDPEMTPRQRVTWQAYALNADRLDGLDQSSFSRTSHSHATLPVAYGFIDAAGKALRATPNVSSVWNAATGVYEITIDRESYFWTSYVTAVTPAGAVPCDRAFASTGSIGGKLTVKMANPVNGNGMQCPFQFVTYKP